MISTVMGFLVSGTLLGLSAGISPGPLLTLVITETLKYNAREGIKIALSPLITDLPIVTLTVFVLSQLADHMLLIGIISLLGGFFIAYLGYESFVFKGADLAPLDVVPARSLQKGIIANFLNPSPYLFWLSIGAPLIVNAWRAAPAAAFAFIFIFYLLLVGSKVFIALAVGKSRDFLKSSHYIFTVRCLGLTLFLFAGFFFKNAYIHLMSA
jgi:threonine/homoserine/homoserine lactone efflux protein